MGGGCPKLRSAFIKYPPIIWTHEILFETNDIALAKQKEIELIKAYDSIESGYNTLPGGDVNTLGKKLSEEHKRKISEGGKGRIQSEATRLKISLKNKGKVRSKECSLKLSKNRLGRTHSEETKRKMSLSQIGKTKGRPKSEETKAKISNSLKGQIISQETREKIGKAHLGHHRKHSEASKLKMSLARRNKPRPEGLRKYWESKKGLST